MLPLQATDTVAVIGELAKATRFQGQGLRILMLPRSFQFWMALSKKVSFDYAAGYRLDDQDDSQATAEALALARNHDKVVFVAGLPDNYESEGFDRQNMALPKVQNDLLQAVTAVNPNVIVLLVAGAPVELPWVDQVKAVVNLSLGGERIGAAAANVLTGAVNPSGKLAESYPLKYPDVPLSGCL